MWILRDHQSYLPGVLELYERDEGFQPQQLLLQFSARTTICQMKAWKWRKRRNTSINYNSWENWNIIWINKLEVLLFTKIHKFLRKDNFPHGLIVISFLQFLCNLRQDSCMLHHCLLQHNSSFVWNMNENSGLFALAFALPIHPCKNTQHCLELQVQNHLLLYGILLRALTGIPTLDFSIWLIENNHSPTLPL